MIIKNGNYIVQNRQTGNKTTIKAYNGYFLVQGWIGLTQVDLKWLETYYTIISEPKPSKDKFNIHWFVNGKTKEVIQMNCGYAICVNKIKELKRGNYKTGKLIIKKII